MSWSPDVPYQDLPTLPPAFPIESTSVLKALVEAKSSLSALNEAGGLIPNPTVLINVIPLLEAQSSSEIENIVTTTDELFRYAAGGVEGLDENSPVRETLRYRTALRVGYESLANRPLCTNTAIAVCREIKNQSIQIRDLPGTKIANPSSGEIIYTPPEGKDLISEKLRNWEQFLHNQTDLDPLVRMAAAHYQFEAIHPFFDGNGRTGRIINILVLVQFDLLKLPVLYLSRYIIENKSEYYRLLGAVTEEEAWEEWVVFMLNAVRETAEWTRGKIHAIRALHRSLGEQIRLELPSIYRRELLDLIFEQPYCRIENVVAADLAQRQTASSWLRSLADEGILREIKVGRNKIFVNHQFFDLLTTSPASASE